MTTPGWRWCPQTLSHRSPLGSYGVASTEHCTLTQDGLKGTFTAIRIKPLSGETLMHSFNLYDETTGNVYTVADCIASDRGTGTWLARTAFELGRPQSDWLDSLTSPALLLEVELVKGRTENTVAALVDVDRHRTPIGRTQNVTYLRRAAVTFMDDVTVNSYRSTAEKVGGWENLQGQMPEWLRLGWRERSEWLVG